MIIKTVTQDILLDYLLFCFMSRIFALPNKNISSALLRVCVKLKLVAVYLLEQDYFLTLRGQIIPL
jgi:hypothetical protein